MAFEYIPLSRAETLHLAEASLQARHVRRAVEAVQASLAEVRGTARAESQDALWFNLDAALAASVRLANIFWPTKAAHGPVPHDRAARLRARLELEEDNFAAVRKVRNSFEHYDERIDHHSQDDTTPFVDRLVSFDGTVLTEGTRFDDYARWFDVASMSVGVFEHSVGLYAVANETAVLGRMSEQALPWHR